ncbi:hypothetical protein G7Y89_g10376 [Cudoniella acicularis]|uniref:Uncharacterized protein n=1 Tax=Cudoniella acicularis TaxID=354080 RepID=A0A8H4W113_9HELO|nr:hypothetical protein G7Y89_g10376 [Cudoniella acicularis]
MSNLSFANSNLTLCGLQTLAPPSAATTSNIACGWKVINESIANISALSSCCPYNYTLAFYSVAGIDNCFVYCNNSVQTNTAFPQPFENYTAACIASFVSKWHKRMLW